MCSASSSQELASALLRDRIGLFAASAPRLSSLVNLSTSTGGGGGGGGQGGGGGGSGAGGETESAASLNGNSSTGGGSEEGRVAVLRTLLARVRLEEDRAGRAETRASLMAIVEPSSAVPVRACVRTYVRTHSLIV